MTGTESLIEDGYRIGRHGDCDTHAARLLNAVFVAPKSRTGRRWKVTGRVLQGRLQLSPQGTTGGFGGVKAIWRTPDELSTWERVK